MGVDVYTPAYGRMLDTVEYKQLQAELSVHYAQPTVAAQNQTDQDWAEWDSLMRRQDRMEMAVGHFRYGFDVPSRLPQINAVINGEDSGFRLSHEEVGVHLQEWRSHLLAMFRAGEYQEVWTDGFGELVLNPFQSLVWKYKLICTAFRLGEGQYVG